MTGKTETEKPIGGPSPKRVKIIRDEVDSLVERARAVSEIGGRAKFDGIEMIDLLDSALEQIKLRDELLLEIEKHLRACGRRDLHRPMGERIRRAVGNGQA